MTGELVCSCPVGPSGTHAPGGGIRIKPLWGEPATAFRLNHSLETPGRPKSHGAVEVSETADEHIDKSKAADGDEDAYTAVLADGSQAILEHLCVGAKQGAEVQRVTV